MPIISRVGARSLRTRGLHFAMFAVLTLGAVTMVYPFLLMLTGSVASETDVGEMAPYPRYLFDDVALYRKYLESRYTLVSHAEAAHRKLYGSWIKAHPAETLTAEQKKLLGEYLAWRGQGDWPTYWYIPAHAGIGTGERAFQRFVERHFGGDLSKASDRLGLSLSSWIGGIYLPRIDPSARRTMPEQSEFFRLYDEFRRGLAPADRVLVDLDGAFFRNYCAIQWPTIEAYNRAHGSAHRSYHDVLLSTQPPSASETLARQDWSTYVRTELNLNFIRVVPEALPAYRAWLRQRYESVERLNQRYGTSLASFDQIGFPPLPATARAQYTDLSNFIRDEQACPLEYLEVNGPRQAFERWLAQRGDGGIANITPLPLELADNHDFTRHKSALRKEFLVRNYRVVLDYIAVHGNGIRNTIIYCGLLILAQLTVNPLAAYALSRYQPPAQYRVLLYGMATMAFPAEVTMIPNFVLLKQFPVYGLFIGTVVAIFVLAAGVRYFKQVDERWVAVAAAGIGVAVGWILAPRLGAAWGHAGGQISLLNTFSALILPAMANGYWIFMLKGFFDTLPRELYESADIDGAGELRKFWMITLALSKPILAVIALGAFTAAYSEFLMALVLVPDRKMWTLMVWLFQLQTHSPEYVVYASLVIAAIPTLLVFILCQNLIIRGIVVPVEK